MYFLWLYWKIIIINKKRERNLQNLLIIIEIATMFFSFIFTAQDIVQLHFISISLLMVLMVLTLSYVNFHKFHIYFFLSLFPTLPFINYFVVPFVSHSLCCCLWHNFFFLFKEFFIAVQIMSNYCPLIVILWYLKR